MHPTNVDEWHEILLRLGAAMILGAILGIDRDIQRKPAGLRVLSMVCLGSAAIVVCSISSLVSGETHDGMLRTVQGILSGIGFLGAGVILRSPGASEADQVQGLTTASSIWVSAILGMVIGVGDWKLTISLFLLASFILIVGKKIENQILAWSRKNQIGYHTQKSDEAQNYSVDTNQMTRPD